MANQVLIAHTGQRLRLDFSQLTSLDDFRAIVTRQTSIPSDCIISLTPQGKPLRLAAFQTEKELYVYDARTARTDEAATAATANLEIPLPKRFTIANPPNDLRDHRALAAWQELFQSRQQWSQALADDCATKVEASQERYAEMDAMMRCLDSAVANLEAVVKGIEGKYLDIKKWTSSAQADYSHLVDRWEQYIELARSIPISLAMLQFMTGEEGSGVEIPKSKQSRSQQQQQQQQQQKQRQATLEDLVDLETARKAGKLAPAALRRFQNKVAELERIAPRLLEGSEKVLRGFEQAMDRSALSHEGEAAQLLQDIQAVAAKIATDRETTMGYADSTRDVLQASKIAATHTERLLPSLKTRAVEMDEMFRYATQARNRLAVESVGFMRTITELTSLSSEVKASIGAVMGEEEDMAHFDYLRLVQQIPFVYASFVSEAIKRREWLDKVKTDSSTLANEMAVFRDEEVKRRRRWQKSVANLEYGPAWAATAADNQVAGLEVNLLGDEAEWPALTRRDLETFLESLQRNQQADADLIADIGRLIGELRAPTRQQSRRIRAFKNGSVHELALGRSGLLIRGDDDVLRSLQDDKGKLEGKLRTAESRVRRLEDLLHRQSQASRGSLVGAGGFLPTQVTERTDSIGSVRQPSRGLGDRRTSLEGGAAAAAVEIRMAQRVQQLETELGGEKERGTELEGELANAKKQTAELEKTLASERQRTAEMEKALARERQHAAELEKELQSHASDKTDLASQMDEANSTKKDLLKNLEALERDFAKERKSLEDEIKRLQARIEDTEDEMEHFGESREHEKATYDEKMHELQAEVERLEQVEHEQRDVALRSQGQLDYLRREAKQQREQSEGQARQLRAAEVGLQKIWEKMAGERDGGAAVAADAAGLVEAVAAGLDNTLAHLQAAEAATKAAETTSEQLRKQLADEAEKKTALEKELAQCRIDLGQLQGRVADNETGSEALRRRIEETEKRLAQAEQQASRLGDEVSAKQAQVGSVEEELRSMQERQNEAQAALASLNACLEGRTLRAKDLSQRLYTQSERLGQLLERLGFSVSREGGSMVIQRIPRAERSGLLMGSTLGGTAAGPSSGAGAGAGADGGSMILRRASGKAPDIELLYWVNSSDTDAEAEQYAKFLALAGSFDMDAFAEAVYRRVKEVEHIGRKLQRDVRGYREKAHALQRESHDKIAFKQFKEGDLALFLPTRNQSSGAWAAFNVGFPHYFLREQEAHRLQTREWLVARIQRVQERVVDLSKAMRGGSSEEAENENENPFDLSDGLRWYLIDAQEDKPGAPATPGLGKSTVASNNVEAMANMHTHVRGVSSVGGSGGAVNGVSGSISRPTGIDGVSKTLSRSLESRRSSTSSRRGGAATGGAIVRTSETSSLRAEAGVSEMPATPTAEAAEAAAAAATTTATTAAETQPHQPQDLPPLQPPQPQSPRRQQTANLDSPLRRSVVWDPLWTVDYRYETKRK